MSNGTGFTVMIPQSPTDQYLTAEPIYRPRSLKITEQGTQLLTNQTDDISTALIFHPFKTHHCPLNRKEKTDDKQNIADH